MTFSIGELVLGHCEGRPVTTVSNLIPNFHPRSVNRARLLFSLSAGEGFETPIRVDHRVSLKFYFNFIFQLSGRQLLTRPEQVEAVINQHKHEINLDSENYDDLDGPLQKICDILSLRPKSVHHTRNHLRREKAGFKALRDLQIPSPDGGYVLADVYLAPKRTIPGPSQLHYIRTKSTLGRS